MFLRGDFGTENVNIAAVQRLFRDDQNDSLSGEKSFVFGKSTSNQVIKENILWYGLAYRDIFNVLIHTFRSRSFTKIHLFRELKLCGVSSECLQLNFGWIICCKLCSSYVPSVINIGTSRDK